MTTEELKQLSWKKYIASTYWKNFRKSILDDPNAVCELCQKPRWSFYKKTGLKKNKPNCQFHLHHCTYDNLGEEKRDDIMCLCSSCHTLIHQLEMMSRTRKGIYTNLYTQILEQTKWRYIPFKEAKK